MKKIAYTLLVLAALSFTVSACTEDNVKPTRGETGSGTGIDPIK